METPTHGVSFGFSRALRKLRSAHRGAGVSSAAKLRLQVCGQGSRATKRLRRGAALLEAMLALSMLTVVGLTLLKISLNILQPRQWALQQSVTDAYMTYERALAERVPFEALLDNDSLWPKYPNVAATANVKIGRLPGGREITGTVTRTRFADTNNYPSDGGDTTRTREQALAANPAAIKVWKAQSVLTYNIGARTYAKTRTVLRTQ